MPGIKFGAVQHSLVCKMAERGIVMSSRKARAVTAIFVDRMLRNAATLDDLDNYILDYWDETGETAVRNVLAAS